MKGTFLAILLISAMEMLGGDESTARNTVEAHPSARKRGAIGISKVSWTPFRRTTPMDARCPSNSS
eukprot:563248-Pyramimonas_sp.AAC.2